MNPSTTETLQLRDIHLPATPEFWPPAPGWWLLAFVILALLSWLSMVLWRRIKIHRQRKHIMGLLQQLEQSSNDTPAAVYLAEVSILMRRVALMHYPRQSVASLTGKDWLTFLDESSGKDQFSNGPGQVLAQGPYVAERSGALDTSTLNPLIHDWIKTITANPRLKSSSAN